MDERGLTAFVVTVHPPAATLAACLGLLVAVLAIFVLRGRTPAARTLIGILWFLGVGVVGYAGICRFLDVRGLDVESISVFP